MYKASNLNVIIFKLLKQYCENNIASHMLPVILDCLLFLYSQKRLCTCRPKSSYEKKYTFIQVRSLNWAVDTPCLPAWGQFEVLYGQTWLCLHCTLRLWLFSPDIYCVYINGKSNMSMEWLMKGFNFHLK